jgi:hypothetical protein
MDVSWEIAKGQPRDIADDRIGYGNNRQSTERNNSGSSPVGRSEAGIGAAAQFGNALETPRDYHRPRL